MAETRALDRELSELDVQDIVNTCRLSYLYDVYIYLGLEDKDVENEKLRDTHSLKKQAKTILNLWRDRNGVEATRSTFIKAMRKCEHCRSSLETLKKKWTTSNTAEHAGSGTESYIAKRPRLSREEDQTEHGQRVDQPTRDHAQTSQASVSRVSGGTLGNVSQQGDGGIAIGGNVTGNIYIQGNQYKTGQVEPRETEQVESQENKQMKQLVTKWRETLKTNYTRTRSKIRFGSFRDSVVDTDDIFVDLTLSQDSNKMLGIVDKEFKSYADLFTMHDKKKRACNHVLLRGVAGSGKSTLISRIAYLWATNLGILDEFTLVMILNVRTFAAGNSLEQVIINQLLPGVSPIDIARVISNTGPNCLFLIDGFDELSDKSWENDTHVLDSPLLVECFLLVTTRPHTVDRFCQRYQHLTCVQVKLSGFSEMSVDEYIMKFFNIHKKSPSDLKSKYEYLSNRIYQVPILRDLSKFPILLLMLCHLSLDSNLDHDLPESMTELYTEGVSYLNKHWEERYMKDKNEVMKELGQVAIDTLFEDKLVFDANALRVECVTDACRIGLVFKEEMERNKTIVSFIHKTFHEFCSAFYWAKLADDGNVNRFQYYLNRITNENLSSMEYLLRFCCGLSIKAASFIFPHVINLTLCGRNREDWQIPYTLFYETKSQGKLINQLIAN